jgi:trimethylamine--corrinoid protein Co-methyltransferase
LGIVTPVTPLKIAIMNEGLIDVVQAGVPVLYSPGPLMGATSPATVAGTIALTMAEVLFGVVLTQLIRPGAPVVLKPDTDVFDMRTTQVTYGSPEQNLGKMAVIQLAHRYQIPVYGLGGGVEGKMPDAEAAAEAAVEMLLNGLAGMTLSQSLGTLSFGMYGSQEMAVICDEIAHSIRRVLDGITVSDETLGLDVIREVGFGGSYLQHDHTVRHFRREMYFPKLFKRQSIDEWIAAGAKMAHEVARSRGRDLGKAGPVALSASDKAGQALKRALAWAEAVRPGLKVASRARPSRIESPAARTPRALSILAQPALFKLEVGAPAPSCQAVYSSTRRAMASTRSMTLLPITMSPTPRMIGSPPIRSSR